MGAVGRQAVVLGASVGGLLVARVLADSFASVTVIERDVLPDGAATRRGAPQARHPHALLTKGGHILDQLFPGLLGELVDRGAPLWDDGDWSKLYMSIAGHVMLRQGRAAFDHKQMALYFPSRPLLEATIRRRVEAFDNVHILDDTEVADLTVTADHRRVTGVTVARDDSAASHHLGADLVVDAMGRSVHSRVCRETPVCGRKPQLSSGPSLSFGYSLQPRVGGSPIRRPSPSVWGFCSELCSAWSASSSWPACIQIQKQHRAGPRRVGIQTPPVAAHRDIGTARLGCDLPRDKDKTAVNAVQCAEHSAVAAEPDRR